MYLIKTPTLVQRLFPSLVWRMPSSSPVIYLTFDDGPIPEVTPWVLDQLDKFNAKATFFCVGDNVRKHPEVYQDLLERGHGTGNHTYNHLDGWGSHNLGYWENVKRCEATFPSPLFRPPYGRLRPRQVNLLQKDYHIIMWDVLSGDFDQKLDGEQCLQNVTENVRSGSIVVFHDSLKAWDRLKVALPQTLDYFSRRGFAFKAIEEKALVAEEAVCRVA
jgi:peptidoglycan/xylan/chitin deacetylase (PgdA/CDA1 family)